MSKKIDVSAAVPAEVLAEGSRVVVLDRLGAVLYVDRREHGLGAMIRKGDPGERGAASEQGTATGRIEPPLNYSVLRAMRNENVHHGACLDAKEDCTVGLGFAKSNQDESEAHPLDELCLETFLDGVIRPTSAEFHSFGLGYIECVSRAGEIAGLHYLPADRVSVWVEDQDGNWHYDIDSDAGASAGDRKFCRFGDKERFLKQHPNQKPDNVSEVIRFRTHSHMSRWYGYAPWLAAVPAIEVVQMLHQWKGDFFINRGVPEFMLFITGQSLGAKDWAAIQTKLKAHVGSGNSHKTMAVNIPGKDVKIQVERLAMEGNNDQEFSTTKDSLALDIVSAHRVPPLLAGIQIPGKLGASNEMTNALLAFQILYCSSVQRMFQTQLRDTLGSRIKGLDGWFKFKSIKDEMFAALAQPGAVALSTVGGMRQGLPDAQAEGRDLQRGLQKGEDLDELATLFQQIAARRAARR